MKFYHCLKHKFRSKGQRSILELEEERQSEGYSETPFSLKLDGAKAHNLRVFSFSELRKATRNFNPELKLGQGGFGSVYKGTIKPDDGKGEPLVVAIKKLKENSSQGHKEWLMEIQFLRFLEHPNVVKLIGHCAVDGERGVHRLLVYEFMPKGSLADHLFSHAIPPLPWKTRLQIVLGAARALAYLHEEFKVQLIHRNFNPSNVLLDDKFNPKLSDFELAREGSMDGDEHVSTQTVGTLGYVAPEYMHTGCLTYKCDVWSFGVVLYEILSGRRPIEFTRPTSEKILLQWVKQFPANNIQYIMDRQLQNQYSIGAACKIAKLADACLSTSPHERPKMSEVVERLKHIIQVSEEETAEKMQNHHEASEIETAETKKKSDNQVSESLKSQMTQIAEESIQEEDTNELLTIKCALENFLKAKRKGKIVLIVESNSATAVKWIEDIESRPRKLWDMLKEIDSFISETGTVVFKILLKETNVIEDCWVKEEVVRSYKLCAWW